MVLINGVKYACERCIRGHRVTTCTHTDQPLMMIKPKGRPSTQCDFCKEQRKIRNSHVHCKCSKKINSKTQHDPDCPCHIDGHCTCCQKKKKKGKDKYKDIEAEAEASITPIGKTPDSNSTTPNSLHSLKQRTTKTSTQNPSHLAKDSTNYDLQSPTLSELSPDLQNNLLSSQNNFNDLRLSEAPSISQTLDNPDIDNDELNKLLHSWDMSSPPMGNSESLASILADASLLPSNIKQADPQSMLVPHLSPPNNEEIQQQQQVQQQQPQLLRNNTISSRRGIGEITLPIDEYMKPLNRMNIHFNNFLSNLSDSQTDLNSINQPSYTANSNNNNSTTNIINNNSNLFGSVASNAATNNSSTTYNNFQDDYRATAQFDIPETNSSGTPGLLDFFENDDSLKYKPQIQNTNNNSNQISNQPSQQNYNYSKPAAIPDHEAESLFPFFSLIGPQSADDFAIGTKNLPQHSVLNAQTKLKQNLTGSSIHSIHSNHSFHSVKSVNTGHHPNQSSHHHHHHQSHFQPYSTKPHRTSSFLSLSSTHSNHSSQSINSILSSPDSVADAPESFFGVDNDAADYNGPQLSNAKTNTTLMDDIYQTKTYTENQSITSVKQQQQQQQQQEQEQQLQQSNQLRQNQNSNQQSDLFLSDILFSNNAVQKEPALIDDFTGETLNNTTNGNVGSIGIIPMTSSSYLTQKNQQQSKSNDQYDDQLLQSLVNNDFV